MRTDPLAPLVDIIIPTFNRAHMLDGAIGAALDQSWWNTRVTVIDDGSSDDTVDAARPYFSHPKFNYVQLAENIGTAQAKNAGLLLTDGDAVTFHDSDDFPHRDKVLHQVRVLTAQNIEADDCLNWALANKTAGQTLEVGAVLTHHILILPDGLRVEIRRDLSLFDDVFPNLQMGTQVPGEWTHINSGLFRAEVLHRLGGFENCIEEDREFRNRLITNGEIVWVIPELLLTKIETPGSLTQAVESDYDSVQRKTDRLMVWGKIADWRKYGRVDPVSIDIPNLDVSYASNPDLLERRNLPVSEQTSQQVTEILSTMSTLNFAAQ